jgi:hypothetical protein
MRLYHPDLDRWHDFGSERSARIARKSGWRQPDASHATPAEGPARAPAIAAATVDQVIAWVGDDPDRAEEALQLEESRPDGPRKTLTEALTPIAIRPSKTSES